MKAFLKSREFMLIIFLAVVVSAVSISNPRFFSGENFIEILNNASYSTVAALGMTMIIITGGIDVASGAVMAVLAIACGEMCLLGMSPIAYLGITLLLGVLFYTISGMLIVKLDVPPMICTLAMSSIIRGLILLITGGNWVKGLPKSFNVIGKGMVGAIPIPVIITLVMMGIISLVMMKTPFGRGIYAVGSNKNAARLAGVNVQATIIGTWAVAGFLLALAAILYATRHNTLQSNIGTTLHIELIAASIIGGTSILGGSGRPVGTFLGMTALIIFKTAMVYIGISTYWEQALDGVLILVAIILGMINFEEAKSKRRQGNEAAQ